MHTAFQDDHLDMHSCFRGSNNIPHERIHNATAMANPLSLSKQT